MLNLDMKSPLSSAIRAASHLINIYWLTYLHSTEKCPFDTPDENSNRIWKPFPTQRNSSFSPSLLCTATTKVDAFEKFHATNGFSLLYSNSGATITLQFYWPNIIGSWKRVRCFMSDKSVVKWITQKFLACMSCFAFGWTLGWRSLTTAVLKPQLVSHFIFWNSRFIYAKPNFSQYVHWCWTCLQGVVKQVMWNQHCRSCAYFLHKT